MRRYSLLGFVVAAAIFCCLSGCASHEEKPDANYSAYLQLIEKQQAQDDQQRAAFATMAQKCTSDNCVTQVAAIAALSGTSNGAHSPPPQQFVPRESVAAKFGLALVSQISPLAAAAVSWHASDASKDVSLAQFGFLGGAVHDVTSSATSLGTTALTTAGGMTPSIYVGHDYVPGTIDNGTHIGGDQIGHDRIDNSGVFIPGTVDRYNSPGPFDDHSASGSGCAGSTTCQVTQPPTPPTPPTTGTGGPTPTIPFGPAP